MFTLFALIILVIIVHNKLWEYRALGYCSQRSPLMIFDATLYQNKPNLSQYGIEPIEVIYEQEIWGTGEDRNQLPNKGKLQKLIQEIASSSSIAILDIEIWQDIQNWKYDTANVENGLQKYITVFQWLKEAAPNLRLGNFDFPPVIGIHWQSFLEDTNKPEYQQWLEINSKLKPLADLSNILFPSLYTFTVDREVWFRYALNQINEARRYQKDRPVYVFLWPQYQFVYVPYLPNLIYKYIPLDFWKFELETAAKYADGIVIWGGLDENGIPDRNWDEFAPWWQATKEFIADRTKNCHF